MIAIVTGASSGLGMEFIRELDKENLDELWLIARNRIAMEELAKEVNTKCRIVSCDLTKIEEIDKTIVPLLNDLRPAVKYCINNAGFGKVGPFDQLIEKDMTEMVNLNCRAVVKLTHLVIPYMQKGSIFIHTSSAASFGPLGGFAVYGATKSFVTSFSIALRTELMGKGIHSTALCPGPIETNFSARAHIGSVRSDSVFKKKGDAKPVIQKAIGDAKKNKPLSIYGGQFILFRILSKLIPESLISRLSYTKIMRTEKDK